MKKPEIKPACRAVGHFCLCTWTFRRVVCARAKTPGRILFYALFCTAATARAQSGHNALLEGDAFYTRQAYEKAAAAYKKATGPAAAYNAGNAVFQLGKYEDAVGFFQQATLGSAPRSLQTDAFFNLGNALMYLGRYADAIKAYEKSLRLTPNRPDARKNLEIAKKKLREQQEPHPPERQPPPPPPPVQQPRAVYLDQARPTARETRLPDMPAETARRLLEEAVTPQEQRNARLYRESASEKPARGKKNW
jgi:tetratricopeptide (TPR) repeat protein